MAEILNVEPVKALMAVEVYLDAGDEGTRQILSGIREFYPDYQKLKGKKVMAVVNLKPRKLKGEMSEGCCYQPKFGRQKITLEVSENLENGSLIS